jgi:EAL domain-containing protein (putative c-di-GMP-specific phosphodiesterase class I)
MYEWGMEEAKKSRAALALEMKRALDDGEFEVWYQPQNDAHTREIVSFEALLRWNHPVRGIIEPPEFMMMAEENGVLVEICDWVLAAACASAATWPIPYRLAVSATAAQLARGDFPARVAKVLEENGLPPRRLEIEISERGIVADLHQALKIVLALREIGVSVAMDDFGNKYSSLSTLKEFPLGKIKINRSFISNVASNEHSAAVVRATLLLGKGLNVPVLAEGVETEESLRFLQEEGCGIVQGFLLGRPMPLSELAAFMAENALGRLFGAGGRSGQQGSTQSHSAA